MILVFEMIKIKKFLFFSKKKYESSNLINDKIILKMAFSSFSSIYQSHIRDRRDRGSNL